ncbi:FAD-binding oxidoreductase [Spongisporangium articulatum]|uniref:FAD-binding oxidoreductase n=1 Tax=Spongisporangium articulatum TaxID=3362603 RepID=A0ABW8AIN2_9ACTN
MSIIETQPTTEHPDQLELLRNTVQGQVYLPGDTGYDTTVSGFNLLFIQRPRIVVAAATAADVSAAVRYAAALNLSVGVQATGHGGAKPADDALLIHTGALTGVQVDPATRSARVEAGARWAAVLGPAQEHGLAPLLGSSSDVGAVGYTLGGGFGWLGRRYGLCSDSVLQFELVTPDGREIVASPWQNEDVFWALKGGGGGTLGVVVAMTIELYPVAEVYAGNMLYPAAQAGEILRRFRDWAPGTDEKLTSAVTLMHFPPLPDVPEPLRGNSFVLVRGCWSGDVAEGEQVMSYWRDWQTPVMDMFGPMPFAMADMISQDPTDPIPAVVSSEWFDQLDDEAIDLLVEIWTPKPGQPPLLLLAEVRNAGGAIRAGASVAVNDRGRSGEFLLEMIGVPFAPDLVPAVYGHIAQARELLAPYVNGATYLNFTEGAEKQDRTAAAFSDEHRARLVSVKRSLDPDNRFSHGFDVR